MATLKYKDILVEAIKTEIKQRSGEWDNMQFDTLYFGGGTPSVLSVEEIKDLVNTVFDNYKFNSEIEFTVEANPDDLSKKYLKRLNSEVGVNRLSVGIQSFHDDDLVFMNRRHNSSQAVACVNDAKMVGFDNITIDLIYGIPGLTLTKWEENIEMFLNMDLSHLAAYHLGIEPKTVFGIWKEKKKLKEISEQESDKHYATLTEILKEAGYEHYEISNFAKQSMYSKHNTGYWSGEPYIGIGPSAHSFNKNERRWNIANNSKYAQLISEGQDYFEKEELTVTERFNDYLITNLRTMWGGDLQEIEKTFGKCYAGHCKSVIGNPSYNKYFFVKGNKFTFTEKGWFVSDKLMVDLIM